MTSRAQYCLMVHSLAHSQDELILNKAYFTDITAGDYIQIVDPEKPSLRLILKATSPQVTGSRLEISLSKTIADALNLKPFSRVHVEKISRDVAEVDFVELSFRRQFLQRGNLWRFKQELYGRPVHVGQSIIACGGIQAQVQELGNRGAYSISGIVSEKTHFVFRSKSARITWLIHISSEMWEFDQNGDVHFEKLLNNFTDPVFDRWKTHGTTHSLTVVFFSRTLYLGDDRSSSSSHTPSNSSSTSSSSSAGYKTVTTTTPSSEDGLHYRDFYKVVLENVVDFEKQALLRTLKRELWLFPSTAGWCLPPVVAAWCKHLTMSEKYSQQQQQQQHEQQQQEQQQEQSSPISVSAGDASYSVTSSTTATTTATTSAAAGDSAACVAASTASSVASTSAGSYIPADGYKSGGAKTAAVPCDAASGPSLEAINTALNLLDKHYIDRDLQRTNNSIVMLSAGGGIFRVKPELALITKQRMLDTGIGLDFISLSQPPLHTVPLFLFDCSRVHVEDFQIVPQWMNMCFIDCKRDSSASTDYAATHRGASSVQGQLPQIIGDNDPMGRTYRWTGLQEFNGVTHAVTHADLTTKLSSLYTSQQWTSNTALTHQNQGGSQGQGQQQHVASSGSGSFHQQQQPSSFSSSSLSGAADAAGIGGRSSKGSSSSGGNGCVTYDDSWGEHFSPTPFVSFLAGGAPGLRLLASSVAVAAAASGGGQKNQQEFVSQPDTEDVRHDAQNANSSDTSRVDASVYSLRSSLPLSQGCILPIPLMRMLCGNVIDSAASRLATTETIVADTNSRRTLEPMNTNSIKAFGSLQIQDYFEPEQVTEKWLLIKPSTSRQAVAALTEAAPRAIERTSCKDREKDRDSVAFSRRKKDGSTSARQHQQQRQVLIAHRQYVSVRTAGDSRAGDATDTNHSAITASRLGISTGISKEKSWPWVKPSSSIESTKSLSRKASASSSSFASDVAAAAAATSAVAAAAQIYSRSNSFSEHSRTSFLHDFDAFDSNTFVTQPDASGAPDYDHHHHHHHHHRTADGTDITTTSTAGISASTSGRDQLLRRAFSLCRDPVPPHDSSVANTTLPTATASSSSYGKPSPLRAPSSSSSSFSASSSSKLDKSLSYDGSDFSSSPSHAAYGKQTPLIAASRPGQTAGQGQRQASGRRPQEDNGSDSTSWIEKGVRCQCYAGRSPTTSRAINMSGLGSTGSVLKVEDGASSSNKTSKSEVPITVSPTAVTEDDANSAAGDTAVTVPTTNSSTGTTNSNDLPADSTTGAAALRSPILADKPVFISDNDNDNNSGCGGANAASSDDAEKEEEKRPMTTTATTTATVPLPLRKKGAALTTSKLNTKREKDNEKAAYDRGFRALLLSNQQKYAVNPFAGKSMSRLDMEKRTHNRRRWSHIFPTGDLDKVGFYGLNWKSLLQPAILPTAMDFLVPMNELKDQTKFEIQGNSRLVPDKEFCSFDTPENVLNEMICQRLAQEYQLVEGVDFRQYRQNMLQNNFSSLAQSHRGELMYVLSIGHHIHFLLYDAIGKYLVIARYLAKHGSNEAGIGTKLNDTYVYDCWVPLTGRYETKEQRFYQFPEREYNWNGLDDILLGYADLKDPKEKVVNAKRIRFALIPDVVTNEADVESYFAKVEKLLQYFRKYSHERDRAAINPTFLRQQQSTSSSSSSSSNYPDGSSSSHIRAEKLNVKLWLRESGPNPKWAFLRMDKVVSVTKAAHLEIHWVACDSWLLDDMVGALFLRCRSWNLRIAQIPELFCASDFRVNPYKPLPFIPVKFPITSAASRATTSTTASPGSGTAVVTTTGGSAVTESDFTPAASTAAAAAAVTVVTRSGTAAVEEVTWKSYPPLTSVIASIFFGSSSSFGLQLTGGNDTVISTPTTTASAPSTQSPQQSQSATTAAGGGGMISGGVTATVPAVVEWVQDDDRETDWTSCPSLYQTCIINDCSQNQSHTTITTSTDFPTRRAGSDINNNSGSSRSAAQPQPQQQQLPAAVVATRSVDRQYLHRLGLACVRVTSHGFLWLQNNIGKVSDVNVNTDRERDIVVKRFNTLTRLATIAAICYEVLIEVVEGVFDQVDLLHKDGDR